MTRRFRARKDMKAASPFQIAAALLATPRVLRARPSLLLFLCRYMRRFRVADVGGKLVLHSHLPPLNSRAYSRFVREHLLDGSGGPSHAQIGVTNACPQRCGYCYNKNRAGRVMDTETIRRTVRDLKRSGVFWIGLTGGEPLLNPDLAAIVREIGEDCAAKLFTTGCTLTRDRARELRDAGLFSVSVSLDHWQEEEHDRARNYPGAYRAARGAIDTFLEVGGIHVGVSAVLAREMINRPTIGRYLDFLSGLGIHEAWLSETKPSVAAFCSRERVVTRAEHDLLVGIQDERNRGGGMTVNYLGHFEDARHFGCSAGRKMVYVDAFGDVSPCVFIPMTFGNVGDRPLEDIVREMSRRFPGEEECFINRHFERLRQAGGGMPLAAAESDNVLAQVRFERPARFFQLHDRRRRAQRATGDG